MGRGKKLRALAGEFGGTCACLFSALSGVVVFVVAAKRESARYQKGSTYRRAEISRGCSCIETPQLQYSVFKKAFRRWYKQKICLSAVIWGRQRAGGAGAGAGQAPTAEVGMGGGREPSAPALCFALSYIFICQNRCTATNVTCCICIFQALTPCRSGVIVSQTPWDASSASVSAGCAVHLVGLDQAPSAALGILLSPLCNGRPPSGSSGLSAPHVVSPRCAKRLRFSS